MAWKHLGVALVPGAALVALEQAHVVVERIVASRLAEGSIASLDYARFLLASAVDPVLKYPAEPWWSSAGRAEIAAGAPNAGLFDEASVRTTSDALFGFTLGLWAWFGGTVVLQKLLYAQRRLVPLIPLAAATLATFAILAWTWAPNQGVRGVALAFSASQIVYFCGALAIQGKEFVRAILPSLLYVLAGALALGLLLSRLPDLPPLAGAAVGLLCVILGWILWTLPSRELRSLATSLTRRLLRSS